jgi:hypothetical protein
MAGIDVGSGEPMNDERYDYNDDFWDDEPFWKKGWFVISLVIINLLLLTAGLSHGGT